MKLRINPYFLSLIKENLVYIVINLGLIIVTVIFFIYSLGRLPEKDIKISTLENDVRELTAKANLLNTPFLTSPQELSSSIKLLDALVPNVEDYFTIVYSLEELSRKTNFIINSYTINLQKSTPNRLQLVIAGTGDQDAFMKFLKDYKFEGGRLMTSNKLELSSRFSGEIKLDVNFYNKDVSLDKNPNLALNEKDWQEINKIRDKVSFLLKESSEESLVYPKKTNPF